MFLLKNFEKIFYKIFNYLIILSLYFLYAQNSYSEENILALIIFLYLKDICLSNYFISELFIRNYRILKNKTDFFHTLFKLIILILILFLYLVHGKAVKKIPPINFSFYYLCKKNY